MFNLTLTVSSSTNGSVYQCHITIDHNGSGLTSIYKGRLIEVITTEGNDQLTTSSFTVVMLCSTPHAVQPVDAILIIIILSTYFGSLCLCTIMYIVIFTLCIAYKEKRYVIGCELLLQHIHISYKLYFEG